MLDVLRSSAMQWLNVSYSVWFNRRHQRVGHLFQGRFKAILVEPTSWGLGLGRYVHLNPVRTGRDYKINESVAQPVPRAQGNARGRSALRTNLTLAAGLFTSAEKPKARYSQTEYGERGSLGHQSEAAEVLHEEILR